VSDFYQDLKVDPSVDAEGLRSAYRQRAKETHPDAGGSREDFERVVRAYAVLSDDTKRRRYDETGKADEGADNTLAQAITIVDGALMSLIASQNLDAFDLIAGVRHIVEEQLAQAERAVREGKAEQARINKARARIRAKPGAADRITPLFEIKARQFAQAFAAAERNIDALKLALLIADDHECLSPGGGNAPSFFAASPAGFGSGATR
jgi:curved DNA-binding protein CbpA